MSEATKHNEALDVVVKSDKMWSQWSPKTKAGLFLFAIILYVYLLMCVKTLYMKSQSLDRLAAMALDTEKMIQHVHDVDQMIARKIEQLDSYNGDY